MKIETGASAEALILRDARLSEEELDKILDPYSITELDLSGKPSIRREIEHV